jgi:hypothetical protein
MELNLVDTFVNFLEAITDQFLVSHHSFHIFNLVFILALKLNATDASAKVENQEIQQSLDFYLLKNAPSIGEE